MDAIAFLESALRPFALGLRSPQMMSDAAPMAKTRKAVADVHGGAAIQANPRSILSAVASLRKTGKVSSFRDFKYACLGVASTLADGWCALADAPLMATVCGSAESQGEPRRRLRCFQALLSSYWTFDLGNPKTSTDHRQGWEDLRDWLAQEREKLARLPVAKPQWFEALAEHSELLGRDPCGKFGPHLLVGDGSLLEGVRSALAIPANSWVVEEAIVAHMNSACELPDAAFAAALPDAIRSAMGKAGVVVGERTTVRCVARLVSRYARSVNHPEHPALRDAAVGVIGNPWLRRPNWDRWVLEGKRPDALAREMVDGWLKSRLVADFFELLAVDGTGSRRRVEYWLRFVPHIDDMWFALGTDAQRKRGGAFGEFRARATGRILELLGSPADNNAFVMRIGSYLAIEFGSHGNAFFLFKWDSLDQGLLDTLQGGYTAVHTQTLKDKNSYTLRLIHNFAHGQEWEQRFDRALAPFIGVVDARPVGAVRITTTQSLAFNPGNFGAFWRNNRLQIQDMRPKGGALWVVGETHPEEVLSQLRSWGFRPRADRGWFKE